MAILFCLTSRLWANTHVKKSNEAASFAKQSSRLRYLSNKGQIVDQNQNIRPDILYKVSTSGGDFYIRKTGVSYVQYQLLNSEEKADLKKSDFFLDNKQMEKNDSIIGHRVDIELIGANFSGEVIETGESKAYNNYYLVHCPDGITHVKSYEKVTIKNVYPGIDWVHYTKDGHLEYDFIVNPGADPNQIKMKVNGADQWGVNKEGDLEIQTSLGKIIERAPIVFQEGNEVASSYKIKEAVLSFEIEEYDTSKKLQIDPIREWATYCGGTGSEHNYGGWSSGTSTDGNGNVFIHGSTNSVNFPITIGAFQVVYASTRDAYLVKFSGSGLRLWGTYYGGSGEENGYGGVATDLNNDVFIQGSTLSTNFPITAGAFQMTLGGIEDAYLVKFSGNGILIWSTYFGGSNADYGQGGVATDLNGNVFIQGSTSSTNFPVTLGAFQMTFAGSQDTYLAKFSGNGIRLWATYFGGSNTEHGQGGIATDLNGDVFIQGLTGSANFPVTTGAFQMTNGGGFSDAYLVKFSGNGMRLWSTLYGGSGADMGFGGVATDQNGNVFIHGYTSSVNFPVTTGAFQTTFGGGSWDVYLVKFSSSGNRLWGTYYGGADSDYGLGGVATDLKGNVFIHGSTSSLNFPITVGVFQMTSGGGTDAYLVKFSGSGVRLWGTYYGGGSNDLGQGGIATDLDGGIFIYGFTYGLNFPVTTGAFQTISAGYTDAYVVKFSQTRIDINGMCQSDSISFNLTDTFGITNVHWNFGDPSSGALNTSTSFNPYHIYSGFGQFPVSCYTVLSSGVIDTLYDTVTIYPSPVLNLGPDTVLCQGDTFHLPFTDTSFSYQWNNGDTVPYLNVTNSGTYSITVSNQCGSDSDSIDITFLQPPLINLGPDTILCLGDSLWLSDSTSHSNFLWNTGATTDSILVSSQVLYSLTVTNACGQFSDSIDVLYDTSPITNLGPDSTYCISSLINLDATHSRASYLWNTGDTSAVIIAHNSGQYSVKVINLCGFDGDTVTINYVVPLQLNLGADTSFCEGDSLLLKAELKNANWFWNTGSTDSTLIVSNEGLYTLTASNECGVFSDSIYVYLETKPILTPVNDTIICEGEVAGVNVSKSNALSIQWADSNNTGFTRNIQQEGEYSYWLTNNCGSTYDTFEIKVDRPVVFSLGNDTTLCGGGGLLKTFDFPNATFSWGDGYEGSTREFFYKGIYTLTVTTNGGCESSDAIEIKRCKGQLFIPNAFTPNNDGLNDYFEIKGTGAEKFSIEIFDRWGNQVFESLDINHSWDGTHNGQRAMLGVYTYKIWYGSGNESEVIYGSVTLVQ